MTMGYATGLTEEELSKAIKNPYFKHICTKVTVAVDNKTYRIYKDIADQNGETVENTMNRCLEQFGKILLETE
ncbi:hypothetical protein FACS1894133_2940 [Clostridia bacterium]|nr:hypothetical protein FACS1894133_2940 [Clostridia bacterium]